MCTSASWSVKYLVLCSLRSSLTVCSNRAFSGPFSRFMCTFSSWSGVVRCVLFALSTNLRAPHLLHSPCDPVPSHPLPTSASIGCGGCAPSSVPFIVELHAHFLPTHDVVVLPFSLSLLHHPPVGSCCSCGSCSAPLALPPSVLILYHPPVGSCCQCGFCRASLAESSSKSHLTSLSLTHCVLFRPTLSLFMFV
jgi:hypothetical protein